MFIEVNLKTIKLEDKSVSYHNILLNTDNVLYFRADEKDQNYPTKLTYSPIQPHFVCYIDITMEKIKEIIFSGTNVPEVDGFKGAL